MLRYDYEDHIEIAIFKLLRGATMTEPATEKPAPIYFAGTSTIILVVNMRQLVLPEQESRNDQYSYFLDLVRCKEEFAQVLHVEWPQNLKNSDIFTQYQYEKEKNTSPERIGFATGMFRQSIVDTYGTPIYEVNWHHLLNKIDEDSRFNGFRNSALFRKYFYPRLREWKAYIRPTTTGLFVIKFVRKNDFYSPKTIQDIVKHNVQMQACIDIEKIEKIKTPLEMPLYQLLRYNQKDSSLKLAPVQWQLASMICRWFIKDMAARTPEKRKVLIGKHETWEQKINLNRRRFRSATELRKTREVRAEAVIMESEEIAIHFDLEEKIYPPIHDSFVIYQVTGLGRYNTDGLLLPIDHTHAAIEEDDQVIRSLYMLAEGSILLSKNTFSQTTIQHNRDYAMRLMKQNKSTMDDELCLLTSRTAIIWPSDLVQDAKLLIGQMPLSIDLTYADYWRAVARMIELIVEIRVLVQVMDRVSTDLVRDFVQELNRARRGMEKGDVELDIKQLNALADSSTNLSRLIGVSQSLVTPHRWSRAEFAMIKANYLIRRMKIRDLLDNAKFNMSILTDLVNHYDDLYLADLTEKRNDSSNRSNIILGLLSFFLLIFIIPSFVTDLYSLSPDSQNPSEWHQFVAALGAFAAFLILLYVGIVETFRIWTKLRKASQKQHPKKNKKDKKP
jgi:Mg2+ and Co2+ transporter CorA